MGDLTEQYEDLANAIIKLATEDYREALQILAFNEDNCEAQDTKNEIELFFSSDSFAVMTGANPEMLLRRLKEETQYASPEDMETQ